VDDVLDEWILLDLHSMDDYDDFWKLSYLNCEVLEAVVLGRLKLDGAYIVGIRRVCITGSTKGSRS
jgi:hypothetical protein